MPRFALFLLTACSINADYGRANLRCNDGKCPSGLTCVADMCTSGSAGGDAAVDAHGDATHDAAHVPALTCADPGDALGTHQGSTSTATNEISASCGTAVYNGPDAIYAITGPRTITVSISGNYAVSAYVAASCTNLPPPSCEGGSAAPPAITVSIGAGTHYVVVDGVNAGLSGMYRLDVQ